MAKDKPWYSLKLDLTSAKTEPMTQALTRLDEITSEHSTPGGMKVAVTFESFQEETLRAIREQFEAFMRQSKLGVEFEVTFKEPGVRPRPEPEPMDDMFEDELPRGSRVAVAFADHLLDRRRG
jgi:hypothetical protein